MATQHTTQSTIQPTYRTVDRIHSAPAPHWVGDGFHVNPMFNHMVGDKRTDPFLLLDYASPKFFSPNDLEQTGNRPHGVGEHPHKGFETVTIAYLGEVAHRDSAGGGGVIKTGDTQWMTAGRGVMHEEFHSPEFSKTGGDFEMVQLWVNLPAKDKLTEPRYQHLKGDDTPVIDLTQAGDSVGKVRLIAGEFTTDTQKQHGIGKTFSPINLWDVTIKAGKTAELNIPKTHNVMLLIRRGEVRVNDGDQSAQAKQLITFAKESGAQESGENGMDTVRLTAGEAGSEILLMSGEPLNEPIAYRGPFVMNTDAEIREAMLEFGRGDFGKLSPVS